MGLPARFFLTVSRLVPKKNVSGLIRAYANYVKQVESPWSLVIVGDGEQAAALREEVRRMGLNHLITFLGYLQADALAQLYPLASAFVLASAYYEQWGLVVNEAMAAGLPVLVSNICGCVPDLIVEGVTGFSFNARNENELASLLCKVAHGNLNLVEMGRHAQEHIANYSPENFAETLFALAQIAKGHAQARRWHYWIPPEFFP